ncbi:hypothetical protein HDV01_004327 [Terramyces sp. JEL0728]|nr:hypothetical protein HDV01_004327 [Terramyces sp. JEL0728]
MIKKRLLRKGLSQQRTKNWSQTIAGQSRLKKQQKEEEQLAKSMAEKAKFEESEREVLQKRNDTIERARRIQYMETDTVKKFNSKINELNILQERDLQIKLKESRRDAGLAEEIKRKTFLLQKYQADKFQETKSIEKFTQQIKLAREHAQQAQEKKLKSENEKQKCLEEGLRLLEDAKLYQEEQVNLQNRKKLESQSYKKELDQMREDVVNRRNWEEYEDYMEEIKIAKWNAFKDHQNTLKEQIEKKWFNEKLASRSRIGENTRQKEENKNERTFEIEKKQELLAQKKAKDEMEMKQNKKRELIKSMNEHYELHKSLKKKQLEDEKQQDLELLEEYRKLAADSKSAKIAEREHRLKTNLEIREYNAELAKQKQARKDDGMSFDSLAAEDMKFKTYMQDVANERWALKNPRIQEYVKRQLRKHEREKVVHSKSKTHHRLGFQGHQYDSIDLAGTNEIAKGNYLDILLIAV